MMGLLLVSSLVRIRTYRGGDTSRVGRPPASLPPLWGKWPEGPMGVPAVSKFLGGSFDRLQHAIQFVADRPSRDAQDPDSRLLQPAVTSPIMRDLLVGGVGKTVDLHRQTDGRAIKIKNVGPDGVLPAKL